VEHGGDVVLLQKGKFVSTLCDRMQGALNGVESWCRKIGLSVNADKTTMVLFTNNRKIGGFYYPRLFGTKLKMTDQVKYLGMIAWVRSLIGKRILKIGCAKLKACIAYWQCRRAVGKTWGFYVDLPTREDWSTECVDLVALDGLVFFTDGSLCGGRAVVGVFSDILNVRVSYALGSHATVFQSILHFKGHGRQNNINLLC
jgi:hypothetical protein